MFSANLYIHVYIHRAVYRNRAAQGHTEDHYEESVVMGPLDVEGDEHQSDSYIYSNNY